MADLAGVSDWPDAGIQPDYPLLVGERIGLHPVAVIFALMAFGQLFGFIGVLLALPMAAVLLVGFPPCCVPVSVQPLLPCRQGRREGK